MKMKRIVGCILLLTLLLSATAVFGGCVLGDSQESDTVEETEPSENTESIGDSESIEDTQSGYIALTENKVALYDFVYQTQNIVPDTMKTNDYREIAYKMADELGKKLEGVEFEVKRDSSGSVGEKRIFAIGNVKGVSDSAYEELKILDSAICKNQDDLIIAGYTKAYVQRSMNTVLDAVELRDGELYVKAELFDTVNAMKYHIENVTLNGEDIEGYVISHKAENQSHALFLQEKLRAESGYTVFAKADDTSDRVILLDNTRESGYSIRVDGKKLIISYAAGNSWDLVSQHITAAINKLSVGESLELADLAVEYSETGGRKILSYNVLNVWQKGGTPSDRDDKTAALVLDYMPDFICLQEFDVGYRNAEGGFISLVSEKYAEVSVSGVNQNEIWNPIFYLKDKYTVVESGYVYFPSVISSYEPSSYTAYDFGDGKTNSRFRSLVWAVLEDRSDGTRYLVGSTHLSYLSDDPNAMYAYQVAEANKISEVLSAKAAQYAGCTTLLAGDLNSTRSENGTAKLMANGFKDTYDTALVRNDYGTSNKNNTGAEKGYMINAIDHILTLNDLTVQSYMVLTDSSLFTVSDHLPTLVQFSE